MTKNFTAHPIPLAYLITFTCFGTRLYGDEAGSVDRNHNAYRAPFLPASPKRVAALQKQMKEEPYELDSRRRTVVLEALRQVCSQRGWTLLAAHVRTQHVHFVVVADQTPERVLTDVKAYASRALNRIGLGIASRNRWTRHGSTRYLWKPEHVGAAIDYVVREQGKPMAVWEKPSEPRASASGQSVFARVVRPARVNKRTCCGTLSAPSRSRL